MDDPNGFNARDAQLTETIFSPNGTVHTVDLRSPGGILYGAHPTGSSAPPPAAPLSLCDSLRGTARPGCPVAGAVGARAPLRRSRTP